LGRHKKLDLKKISSINNATKSLLIQIIFFMAKIKFIGGSKVTNFTPQVAPIEWWNKNKDRWDKNGDLGAMVNNTEPLFVRVERINRLPYYLKIRMEILTKNCGRSPYFKYPQDLHLSALHLELQICEIVAELDKEYPSNDASQRPEIPHEVILQKILRSDFCYSELTIEVAEMAIRHYLHCLACDALTKPELLYSKLLRLESMTLLRVIDSVLIRSYQISTQHEYIKDIAPQY